MTTRTFEPVLYKELFRCPCRYQGELKLRSVDGAVSNYVCRSEGGCRWQHVDGLGWHYLGLSPAVNDQEAEADG